MRALQFCLKLLFSLGLLILLTCTLFAVPPGAPQTENLNPLLALAPGEPAPADQSPQKPVPVQQPAANPCLPEPKHFTARPDLTEGTELVLTRYLRFVTPDGRAVFARMFLLEIHPERAKFPDAPKEVQEKRRRVPQRLVAVGHEIAVEDPLKFEPDFDVPVQYVRSTGRCAYEVDLGSVKCHVRTTE